MQARCMRLTETCMKKDSRRARAARLGHAMRRDRELREWSALTPEQQRDWIEAQELIHPGRELRRVERAEREARRQALRIELGLTDK